MRLIRREIWERKIIRVRWLWSFRDGGCGDSVGFRAYVGSTGSPEAFSFLLGVVVSEA